MQAASLQCNCARSTERSGPNTLRGLKFAVPTFAKSSRRYGTGIERTSLHGKPAREGDRDEQQGPTRDTGIGVEIVGPRIVDADGSYAQGPGRLERADCGHATQSRLARSKDRRDRSRRRSRSDSKEHVEEEPPRKSKSVAKATASVKPGSATRQV